MGQFLGADLSVNLDTNTFWREKRLFVIFSQFSSKRPLGGCHGNKGRSIFLILASEHHLYMFRKSHKVSRKNLWSFRSYAPNITEGS